MILVHVYISPRGVHQTNVEVPMDRQEEARLFYEFLKPLLRDLDQTINDWRALRRVSSDAER